MKKYISVFILCISTIVLFSQEKKKDTLDTEVINVVKPYTPTVSDAFKIKVAPEVNDSKIGRRKPIEYSIFSIPVASTFTPAKGKAKVLRLDPSAPIYENYITAGFGNFGTPAAEIFAHGNSTRYNEFGGFLKYHSSKGGIDGIVLDNNFLDTRLDFFYKQEERDFDWQLNGGFRYQKYNWYGLPEAINFDQNTLSSINESQNYTEVYLGGKISYNDSFFQGGTVELNRFTDNEGSSEIHLLAKPKIEFPIASEYINLEARIEVLKGEFFSNYDTTSDISYTYLNLGINPNFEVLRDNLTLNLGVDIIFSGASGVSESKAYFYPKITASFILIDQIATLYAGVLGGLQQNSFRGFVNENPFVSPTLNILRTDQQYNAYGGIRGKLASNVSYNLKGGYMSDIDKPLFKLNATKTDGVTEVAKGFEAGNSFQVVYDDVKTLYAFAEVSVDFSKQLKFGGNIEYNNYSTTNEIEPWGLPNLKATAFANYNVNKWFAGADLYFVGQRMDELTFEIPNLLINRSPELIDVGNYVDLNLNAGYKFTDRLTAFAKVNNVLSSNYQKYTNFEVQGLQFFAGLTYKFDL
jgi:hypothetical protein